MAFKQGKAGDGANVATLAVTLPGAVTVGDSIFVATATNTAQVGNTVTDNISNSYTLLSVTGSTTKLQFWYALASKAGTPTVTLTIGGGASDFCGIVVGAFSSKTAPDAASPTWKDGTVASTSPVGTAITPAVGATVISILADDDFSAGDTTTPTGSWSDGPTHQLTGATGNQPVAMEFIENSPASAQTAGWTLSFAEVYRVIEVAFTPEPYPTGYNVPAQMLTVR